MLHSLCRNDQVSDVKIFAEGTGNTGVDDFCHVKSADQDLGTDPRIYLSHSGLYENSGSIFQRPDIKIHCRTTLCPFNGHRFTEESDFIIHCSDNTKYFLLICHDVPLLLCFTESQN